MVMVLLFSQKAVPMPEKFNMKLKLDNWVLMYLFQSHYLCLASLEIKDQLTVTLISMEKLVLNSILNKEQSLQDGRKIHHKKIKLQLHSQQ
jgi:hypothetical protein